MPEGPPSEIDLTELVTALVRQHGSPDSRIEIRTSEDVPLILGHYEALVRVFRNLLVNAMEAAGGAADVPADILVAIRARPDSVEVSIQDSGPGFPTEALDRIWEPDFTTKSRGTGLGLPLVRQTVHAHRGKVEVRNRPEGGAKVTVSLPTRGAGGAGAAHPPE
jgi:signal transduction histidine kinase